MIKDDSEVRGEHVSEAIKHIWEKEAAGHATIERWVTVVTCDGHWRFNPCKNIPHLNPNLLSSPKGSNMGTQPLPNLENGLVFI